MSPHPSQMISRIAFAALFLAFASEANVARAKEALPSEGKPNPVLSALGLLPADRSGQGGLGPDYLQKQLGRELSAEESALLKRDAGGGWRTFSDDLITFEVPDDPLLFVEPFTPSEHPKLGIVGGAVGTTDHSFTRVYRMTMGRKLPYG